MKRTRTDIDSAVPGEQSTWTYHNPSPCEGDDSMVYSGSSAPLGLYSRRLNQITDELLPKSDKRTRYCKHLRLKWYGGPYDRLMSDRMAPAYASSWHEEYGISIPYSSLPVTAAVLDPQWGEETHLFGDLDAFNARAYDAMKPSLEGDVSLTNFLLELSDFKDIFRLFSRVSSVLKKISEGHLTWSFGIKPMLSDVPAIYNGLLNYEKIIKDFLDRSKIPQKRYYSETTDLTDEDPAWAWYQTNYYWGRVRTKGKLIKTATMSYSYDVDYVNDLHHKLLALRAILGLRGTASVVWEAIPFSFVVDWIVNVGQFLESREDDLIEPDVFVTDYSVSVKVSSFERLDFRLPEVCNRYVNYEQEDVAQSTVSFYWRKRTLPNTSGIPLSLSLPSSNQLMLAASLINVAR